MTRTMCFNRPRLTEEIETPTPSLPAGSSGPNDSTNSTRNETVPDFPPTRERIDRFASVTHTGHGLFVKTSDKPDGIITITLQYRDPETGVDRPAQAAVVWDLSKDSPDVAIAESLIWHLKELIRTNGVQR